MVGVNGAGLEKAIELVRSVGVLTAADSVERVRQAVEIALGPGQGNLASEPRRREPPAQSDAATDRRQGVRDPSTPRPPPDQHS
jgi:hypothetical protein